MVAIEIGSKKMKRTKQILCICLIAALVLASLVMPVGAESLLQAEDFTLDVSYGTIKCGTPTEFTLTTSGGSGTYKYMFNCVYRYTDGQWSYDTDPSKTGNLKNNPTKDNNGYQEDNTFKYTFYASGYYRLYFYTMDLGSPPYKTKRVIVNITINDPDYPTAEAKADAVAQQCLDAGNTTDFDKALWLHDWVINNCKYDYTYLYCGAEGALCRGTGTCSAYHQAYTMLLNRVGIENSSVQGAGHVWTGVKLDGKWYQVDTTWDDGYSQEELKYMYFGVTQELKVIAHQTSDIEDINDSTREYTSLDENYFIHTGKVSKWADPVKKQIQENLDAGKTSFDIVPSNELNVTCWYVIYRLVAYSLQKEEYTSDSKHYAITASYVPDDASKQTYTGGKIHVEAERTYNLRGNVNTSCKDGTSIEIIDKNGVKQFAQINGNSYSCKLHDEGEYKVIIKGSSNYVSREYSINMTDDVIENLMLCQLGDANCDGGISAADITQIARHIARLNVETDDYTLKLFNVDRSDDGIITASDATKLARYASGVISSLA